MKLNRSGEDYLKAIMALKQEKDKVRSSDIAKYMNVTKPSVSNAVRSLKEGGFLMMDEDKNILFTERGQEAAKQVYERNRVIEEMLVFIGVEPEIAGQDACRIEHDISSQSFEIVKALWEKYQGFSRRSGTQRRKVHLPRNSLLSGRSSVRITSETPENSAGSPKANRGPRF